MSNRAQEPPSLPTATAERLAMYLRELQRLGRAGEPSVSSHALGTALGVSADVIRKDMVALGHAGRRGVGYPVQECETRIRELLGQSRRWRVLLLGAGSLGRALTRYRGFSQQGLDLVAAIDQDVRLVGQSIGHVEIYDPSQLPEIVQRLAIDLAVLAVPAEAASGLAKQLADAGVAGILNFAPVTLASDPRIEIRNVDLSSELLQLAFSARRSGRLRS
jgi:redox-sensing transcriptional repressor